jgi:exosome complex component MTR3
MATFDRRRVQAPESSALQYDAPAERVNEEDICEFDRGCADPVLDTGLVTQANGSAYIESGRTKIACSV